MQTADFQSSKGHRLVLPAGWAGCPDPQLLPLRGLETKEAVLALQAARVQAQSLAVRRVCTVPSSSGRPDWGHRNPDCRSSCVQVLMQSVPSWVAVGGESLEGRWHSLSLAVQCVSQGVRFTVDLLDTVGFVRLQLCLSVCMYMEPWEQGYVIGFVFQDTVDSDSDFFVKTVPYCCKLCSGDFGESNMNFFSE